MPRIAVGWLSREVLFLAYLPQRFPAAAPFTRCRRTTEVLKQTSVSRGYTIPEPGAGDYAKTGSFADSRQLTAQACCVLFLGGVLANTVHRLASARETSRWCDGR